mgnify:CR=1 FL=1
MKVFLKSLLSAPVLFITTSVFWLSGCQQPSELQPQDGSASGTRRAASTSSQTILEIAASNPAFTALAAAAVKTDLTGPLGDPSASLTVFAPTNDAFAQLPTPFNSAANISAISNPAQIAFLKNVLLYHVLGAEVKLAQVANGASSATTLKPKGSRNDNTIYLFKQRESFLTINGNSLVTTADVDASNGVIHVINSVLLPPSQTIAEIAVGNPAFSTLVAALAKANLVNVFTGEGDFTVFAPTNDAFAKLPAPFNNAANISAITDPATISALGNILRYHVLANRVFTPDLGFSGTQTTLADAPSNTLTTRATPPLGIVRGAGNRSFSQVVIGNVLATNGVVHAIDQVLLP